MGVMEEIRDLLKEQNGLLKKLATNQGVTPDNQMLEPKEAAKYLQMSYDTVMNLARQGKIPHSRPGRRVLFSKKALDEWIVEKEKASLRPSAAASNNEDYGKLRQIK